MFTTTICFEGAIAVSPHAALLWTGRFHRLSDDDREPSGVIRRGVASTFFWFGGGAQLRSWVVQREAAAIRIHCATQTASRSEGVGDDHSVQDSATIFPAWTLREGTLASAAAGALEAVDVELF